MTTNDSFANLPDPISSALTERGFTELTAVQKAVVDAESQGRDLRISSQTGSGKTVAIGIALASQFIERLKNPVPKKGAEAKDSKKSGPPRKPRSSAAHPSALVIVPTRELAAQVREELKWLYANLRGLKVEVVTGGTSIEMERRALARGPGLVVGTPGRLLDHMRNHALDCDSIEHVILDEADQMLDMGFREELEGILEQLPESRASHLMSATFPGAVVSLAKRYQKNGLKIEGTRLGVANADIRLAGDSRCLLFDNRRVDATELAEKLASDGFGAAPFSGELPQAQRTRTLAAFRSGTFNILVSTDVAARGIDVPDISTVVHIDPPRNSDAYIHRSGRTGRAGRTGQSILFVAGPDSRKVARMLQAARIEVSWQPVPTPDKVQKALVKQARREMHARLAESAPTEAQLIYAKQLIEEKDATHVVATLLEMAKSKPPRDPMNVVGLDPFADNRSKPRGAGQDTRRGGYAARASVGSGGGARPSSRGPESFTRFTVSWGEQTGASPSRLLSHICRRGGLESHQVGSIQISPKSSTVDIASDVADAFETRARRPDRRDPGIMVRRDEARPGSPSSFSKKSSGKGKGAGFSASPSGSSREPRHPNAKRPGRPAHLKRKNPRRTASR